MKNSDLKAAQGRINEGNMKLQKALKGIKLSKKDIQEAQSLTDMGIERKHKVRKK